GASYLEGVDDILLGLGADNDQWRRPAVAAVIVAIGLEISMFDEDGSAQPGAQGVDHGRSSHFVPHAVAERLDRHPARTYARAARRRRSWLTRLHRRGARWKRGSSPGPGGTKLSRASCGATPRQPSSKRSASFPMRSRFKSWR